VGLVRELAGYREMLEDHAWQFKYPVLMMHGKKDSISSFNNSLSIFKEISSP
jgi:acylglycerol lipase